MSHSGNQGPDWYFRLIGARNAKTGIKRFAALLCAALLIAALTSIWIGST